MGKYLQTAQFARMCNVSRQTLIYYDRIGLFHPHHCDSRGYRFYDITQHEAFTNISMLVELGTPLEDIKSYIVHKSPDSFLSLMDEKRAVLKDKIRRLQEVDSLIGRRTQTIREAVSLDSSGIHVETLPEELILLSEPLKDQSDEEFSRVISEGLQLCEKQGIRIYGYGAIVDIKRLLEKGEYWISHMIIRTEQTFEEKVVKPGGLYATAYHRGSYDTTPETYLRLMTYLKETELSVRGDAYEDDLLDSFTQKREEEYLIRISIPVISG